MDYKFEIVLIGSGYYVCGGKTKNFGTILPGILTFSKINKISIKIIVAINKLESANTFSNKFNQLKDLLGIDDLVKYEFIFCNGSSKNFISQYSKNNKIVAGIISIPDHLHFEWSKTLIEAKIPILVVKPLTLKLEESNELFNLSKDLSIPIFVEFHKRFDRQLKYAKDSFMKGLIGIPLYSFTEYTQRKEVPLENFRSWVEKSNIFSYLGVHYVDVIKYVTGSTPKRVSATGQKYFLSSKGINTFDSIQCNIIWETNNKTLFNQIIISNWVESNKSSAMSKQDFHLIGTSGRIDCEQKERGLRILTDTNYTEEINPDFTRIFSQKESFIFEGYGIDSIKNYLHNILNQDFQNLDCRACNIEDALSSTAVIDAASKSIINNSEWIEIDSTII